MKTQFAPFILVVCCCIFFTQCKKEPRINPVEDDFIEAPAPAAVETMTALEEVSEIDEFGVKEVFLRRTDNFAKEGLFQRFNADGKLIEEANYSDNKLHGTRILFFDNGDTSSIETLVNGLYEGPYRLYHDNGTLAQDGNYTNNEMTGSWNGYYKNGQLKEVVQFEANAENGPFIEYHENGQLKAEGSYLNGDKEHGELLLYDEDGLLLRRMECDRGICRTVWKKGQDDT